MEKSPRAMMINSASSITPETVSQSFYLTQYGLMAERHWREFLPKMVRKLEAEGRLMEALFEAQETTKTEMENLRTEFRRQGLTEQQAHDQAWEIVRTRYILLEPEETDTSSSG